jgi:hypothetical protein
MTEAGKQRVSKANTGWLERRIQEEIQYFCMKLKRLKKEQGNEAVYAEIDSNLT